MCFFEILYYIRRADEMLVGGYRGKTAPPAASGMIWTRCRLKRLLQARSLEDSNPHFLESPGMPLGVQSLWMVMSAGHWIAIVPYSPPMQLTARWADQLPYYVNSCPHDVKPDQLAQPGQKFHSQGLQELLKRLLQTLRPGSLAQHGLAYRYHPYQRPAVPSTSIALVRTPRDHQSTDEDVESEDSDPLSSREFQILRRVSESPNTTSLAVGLGSLAVRPPRTANQIGALHV